MFATHSCRLRPVLSWGSRCSHSGFEHQQYPCCSRCRRVDVGDIYAVSERLSPCPSSSRGSPVLVTCLRAPPPPAEKSAGPRPTPPAWTRREKLPSLTRHSVKFKVIISHHYQNSRCS